MNEYWITVNDDRVPEIGAHLVSREAPLYDPDGEVCGFSARERATIVEVLQYGAAHTPYQPGPTLRYVQVRELPDGESRAAEREARLAREAQG